MRFNYDLKIGQEAESQLVYLFQNKGYTVTTTQDKGLFADYDVEVINEENDYCITFEVKKDTMAPLTNNVAVEISKTINGEEQPSGLSTTKAHLYAYKFPNDNSFYAIDTEHLKIMVEKGIYKFKCSGGDGNRSNLVLFDLKLFKKHAVKINEHTI